MKISDLSLGMTIHFVPCNKCIGKGKCYFCKPGVESKGVVTAVWFNYDIPTVEVKVKGSYESLELTQFDLDDPELVVSGQFSEVINES